SLMICSFFAANSAAISDGLYSMSKSLTDRRIMARDSFSTLTTIRKPPKRKTPEQTFLLKGSFGRHQSDNMSRTSRDCQAIYLPILKHRFYFQTIGHWYYPRVMEKAVDFGAAL